MQLSSLLGHTQELLGIIRNSDTPAKRPGRPADSLIDSFFRSHKYLGSHDRKFIAETTYGVLRHLRLCETRLSDAVDGKDQELSREDHLVLLIAAYLVSVAGSREITAEILSTKIGSSVLKESIPAILEKMSGSPLPTRDDPVNRIGIQYSFPDWMVNRFLAEFDEEEAEKLCSSLNAQAPITLRVNTLKATVEECQRELRKEGIETTRTKISPFGLYVDKRMNVFSLNAFRDGMFEVQDEGSQILPLLIDPKPTAKVLDACAGAGGKALEFAALMQNRGEIFATDISKLRIEELRKRARRAGAFNIRPKALESLDDLAQDYTGFFDLVFVDAPCTGVGTIRRNPGMKWSVTENMVNELAEKQQSILRSCKPLVKNGGKIVYATCSLFTDENEDVVEKFVEDNSNFSLIDLSGIAQRVGVSGQNEYFRLLPHIHGTDGFFCAAIEKSKGQKSVASPDKF